MSEETPKPESEQQPDKVPLSDKKVTTDFTPMIPEEAELLIKGLPEPQQKAVQALLVALSVKHTSWRSPIPPPDILKGYNEEIPNGAERILIMAEKQSAHRMDIEKKAIPEDQVQSSKGQLFGFILALTFLVASFSLIAMGHGTEGTILGTFDLVGLVSVFVIGRRQQHKDEEDDE
jgi:uncharacterized membrane protein